VFNPYHIRSFWRAFFSIFASRDALYAYFVKRFVIIFCFSASFDVIQMGHTQNLEVFEV